jgi:hypothetical protein
VPADEEMAIDVGLMRAPVLTTDRQWAPIADDVGVKVEVIR